MHGTLHGKTLVHGKLHGKKLVPVDYNTNGRESMACTNVFSLFLIPITAFNSQDFDDIMHLPNVSFPFLPLPHYAGGLMKIVVSNRNERNFRVQLEFLIDGMDIDEEWCDNYLHQDPLKNMSKGSAREV